MLEVIGKGGLLMYPIGFCSVLALAIFLQKVWLYFLIRKQSLTLGKDIREAVENQNRSSALELCIRNDGPLPRILESALRSESLSRDYLKGLVEEVGSREAVFLERYLGLLGTIATIAPLLGLLGTVIGMIKAFTMLSVEGVGSPATLGVGISEALITTAAGMTLAIPVILMHRYLVSRAERILLELEESSMSIVDTLSS